MALSALLDSRTGERLSFLRSPSLHPAPANAMTTHTPPRSSLRRLTVTERRYSTLRLLALQLTITLVGALLLTSSLLA